jgi:hypothetical protein
LYILKQTGEADLFSVSIFSPAFHWAGLTETVYNLRFNGRYEAAFDDLTFHAHRMPATPLLMAAFSFVSDNAALFLILKNCSLYFLFAVTSGMLFHKVATFGQFGLFFGLFYFNPLFFHTFPFLYEEGFVTLALASTFCLLLLFDIRGNFLASLLVAFLYLTKSTVNLTCFLLAAFACLHPASKRRQRVAIAMLAPIALASLGWGAANYRSTGRFTFGASLSSLNGVNFYKGNNLHTDEIYPASSLDKLENERYIFWGHDLSGAKFSSEWESSDYYYKAASDFIKENLGLTARRFAMRIFLVFFEVREWSRSGGGFPIWPFLLINRVVMLSCLVFAFSEALRGKADSKFIARLYLGIVATYSLPLIIGFVYIRHLVPLFAVSIVYFPLLVDKLGNGLGIDPCNANASRDS